MEILKVIFVLGVIFFTVAGFVSLCDKIVDEFFGFLKNKLNKKTYNNIVCIMFAALVTIIICNIV